MLSIIVAKSLNNCIGIDNNLPWHLSSDLKKFKQITIGHKVIMGRKTFESIFDRLGKPLPDRQSIIITRNKEYKQKDCIVLNTLDEAIKNIKKGEEGFIIGGADIYNQAIKKVAKLYITEIKAKIDGNKFFPEIDNTWEEIKRDCFFSDEKNEYDYDFIEYIKK